VKPTQSAIRWAGKWFIGFTRSISHLGDVLSTFWAWFSLWRSAALRHREFFWYRVGFMGAISITKLTLFIYLLGIQFARLVESAFSARAWDVGFIADWFVEQFFFICQPFD